MNPPALQLKSVTKEFPGGKALSGVDFVIKQGLIHGFLGPNGAGKSTTMNIIAGILPPSSGEILIFGKNIQENPHLPKKYVGFLPETPPLYGHMAIEEYLIFVQELYGGRQENSKKLRERILFQTGLKKVKKRLIGNLSKGFKQRVGLAQALVHNPEIIILDEPTVGLDPHALVEIRNLILGLKGLHTVLLSTHLLTEASKICDEVTMINKGKTVLTGPLADIQKHLRKKRILKAQVLHWNQKEAQSFERRFGFKAEIIPFKDNVAFRKGPIFLEIAFKGQNQKKSDISQFLSEKVGLIEFGEKKRELEEIFKEIIP